MSVKLKYTGLWEQVAATKAREADGTLVHLDGHACVAQSASCVDTFNIDS